MSCRTSDILAWLVHIVNYTLGTRNTEGLEIKKRSIAVCIHRMMWSCHSLTLPYVSVPYVGAHIFVPMAWLEVHLIQDIDTASELIREAPKYFLNFTEKHAPRPPKLLVHFVKFRVKCSVPWHQLAMQASRKWTV